MFGMGRREFVALLGGGAAWPLAAHAQQGAMPVIGILIGGWTESFAPFEPAFRKGLSEGGFPDGSNAHFESRWANGQVDRLPGLAVDLVGRKPTVIATQTLPAALAAKAATSTIPVVFVIGEDPLKVGLVGSLSRPGGNVTGMTNFMNVLGAKRLELVSEAVPAAVVLGLLVNPTNPNAEADTHDLQAAAQALGRQLQVLTAGTDPELEAAFAAAVDQKVGALFINIDSFLFDRRQQIGIERTIDSFARVPNGGIVVPPDSTAFFHRDLIIRLAAQHHLPSAHSARWWVEGGALMSYGTDRVDAFRQVASFVDRILRGSNPGDLPVQTPTKYETVVNLKTAKALGLTVPPGLLVAADEVIE